jgi:hypothetical protein
VSSSQGLASLGKRPDFRLSQVIPLILGEHRQQVDRHPVTAIEIHDARAASLPSPSNSKPHLAKSATAANERPARRFGSNKIDGSRAFVLCETGLGRGKICGGLDDSPKHSDLLHHVRQ